MTSALVLTQGKRTGGMGKDGKWFDVGGGSDFRL